MITQENPLLKSDHQNKLARYVPYLKEVGKIVVVFLFPKEYSNWTNYKISSTEVFDKWFSRLRDNSTEKRVLARLGRLENGNFGDFKKISEGLFELRFFSGSGVRIYYTFYGDKVVLLLAGGDKSTQTKDIKKAQNLLSELE